MPRDYGPRPEHGVAHIHSHYQPLPEFPALVYVSEGVALHNHNLDPHTHETFEICYIHKGRGEWFVEGHQHTVNAGDLYIVRPGEVHGGHTDPREPYHIFALCFDIGSLPVLSYSSRPKQLSAPVAEQHAALSDVTSALQDARSLHDEFLSLNHRIVPGGLGAEVIFRKILTELDATPVDPRFRTLKIMMVQALLVELLVFVARAYAVHGAACMKPSALPAPSDARLSELLRYLSTRLADPPSLAAMAERIGLSPAYLAVLFKQQTGQTPLEYMTAARIAEGARRLRESNAPVTDIALDLGFVTPQYFSMVFKRQKGCTPTEWRGTV